ncbi:hypothetical protein CCHL11_03170 [Colletotrichum chlorophyti]|uniref:Uncharacterized protein n=1 Tax=Colletotrichum chlorophyti TaxID=708187 RepID=A0A1Q8RGB5_9PEZI|nr:hypothetical protein CCHL11_03170 [Colletotrichum chlorophyti]
MVSARIFALFAATSAVIAAPLVEPETAVNLTNVDRNLRNGEVLVVGNDRSEIVTKETWHAFLKGMGVSLETPEIDYEYLKAGDAFAHIPVNETGLDKRDCDSNYQVVVDRSERFVDWDVQMSPVVIGTGSQGISITISKSWSVENKLKVSTGIDLGLVKKILGVKFGVDYARSWKTEQGQLIRGTVDNGYTGVVVTQPWTNRKYGRTFQGCVGSLRQTGTFMADSHEEGSYEGITWVAGAITACIKRQRSLPLTRCQGSGEFR